MHSAFTLSLNFTKMTLKALFCFFYICYFIFFILIGVHLLYNAVLVSAV